MRMIVDSKRGNVWSRLETTLRGASDVATKKLKFDNGGFMSWGQGVKVGLGVILIGIIISIIYQQIFQNFIEPDFMEQALAAGEQKLVEFRYRNRV